MYKKTRSIFATGSFVLWGTVVQCLLNIGRSMAKTFPVALCERVRGQGCLLRYVGFHMHIAALVGKSNGLRLFNKKPRMRRGFICWIFLVVFYSTFRPGYIHHTLIGLYPDVSCCVCRSRSMFYFECYKFKILFDFEAKIGGKFFSSRSVFGGNVRGPCRPPAHQGPLGAVKQLLDLVVQVFGAEGFGDDLHESFFNEVDAHILVDRCSEGDSGY